MLFKECDASNSGWVSVDTLVSTIRGMLHSSPKKGEDVYDSEENVIYIKLINNYYCTCN